MNRIDGGEAIVQSLLLRSVGTFFGLPGVPTYPLFDAPYQDRDTIRVITPRHAQAATYAAFGHTKSTGMPGVFPRRWEKALCAAAPALIEVPISVAASTPHGGACCLRKMRSELGWREPVAPSTEGFPQENSDET